MRNFDRYPINSTAVIGLNGNHYRVHITNFSRMGIGLISAQEFQLKTFISLLYQNETQQIIQMKSYLKHIRKLNSGLFFIGLQFIGIETKFDHAV